MFLDFLFKNNVIRQVERKQKLEGEVEVLKKQQKVESEKIIKDFAAKKIALADSIQAQIGALQAQIASLKNQKTAQLELLDEQKKVTLDKKIHDYDNQIICKRNKVKRLIRFIDAEQQNMQDVINPDAPNAPAERHSIGFNTEEKLEKKILLEENKKSSKRK